MPCRVTVVPLWEVSKIEKRDGLQIVSTVSSSKSKWERNLSPFILGPCKLYEKFVAQNVENGWQYSKVYPQHSTKTMIPTMEYWEWAKEGWANQKAVRYPMGKGKKPLYSWWGSTGMGYISARKIIYAPLYAEAVMKTEAWNQLEDIYKSSKELVLVDYDAYDHRTLGYTLTDVLNNPNRKMGHAFVLMMLLTKDKALNQLELRE